MPKDSAAEREAQEDALRKERSYDSFAGQATSEVVMKPIALKTGLSYGRMLGRWDRFAAKQEGKVSPLDVKTAKEFLKWHCDGCKGRLPADNPKDKEPQRITQEAAYSHWKSFMSAWYRRTKESFPRDLQSTITWLIHGGDDNWLNLRTVVRKKFNFTLTDFNACMCQLWQNDWHDFRAELSRVLVQLGTLLHCGTSARTDEYVRNLRYRDTELCQMWRRGCRQPQVVIDLSRNHTKGLANVPREQPEHLLYELVGLPFFYNTVLFFMAPVLAMQGLLKYKTWSDICDAPKPHGRNFEWLEYNPKILDMPVFRRLGDDDGGDIQVASSIVTAIGELGLRTGFRQKPTPGAIRREALLKVDRHGYSINERMGYADHLKSDTYGGYYQHAISTVDGQATYFGFEQQLSDMHELFRSFSIRRNYNFYPELPQQLQGEVEDSNALDSETSQPLDRASRQKQYENRRQQRDRLAREHRQLGGHGAVTTSEQHPYESDFQQARRLMPERDRLAVTLFTSGSLRDPAGRAIMDDLVALCSSKNSDTYCASLNESDNLCTSCDTLRSGHNSHNWWRHVYSCRKRRSKNEGRVIDFCFLCFEWVEGLEAWKHHTSSHLSDIPWKCNLATFRGSVIRPGLCPDCISRGTFRQFLNPTEWKAHTEKEVHSEPPGSYLCRHPRCIDTARFSDLQEYVGHRHDVHRIPVPHDAGREDTADGSEVSVKEKVPLLGVADGIKSKTPPANLSLRFVSYHPERRRGATSTPIAAEIPPTECDGLASRGSQDSPAAAAEGFNMPLVSDHVADLEGFSTNTDEDDESCCLSDTTDAGDESCCLSDTTDADDESCCLSDTTDADDESRCLSDTTDADEGHESTGWQQSSRGFPSTPTESPPGSNHRCGERCKTTKLDASAHGNCQIIIPLRPEGWDDVPAAQSDSEQRSRKVGRTSRPRLRTGQMQLTQQRRLELGLRASPTATSGGVYVQAPNIKKSELRLRDRNNGHNRHGKESTRAATGSPLQPSCLTDTSIWDRRRQAIVNKHKRIQQRRRGC